MSNTEECKMFTWLTSMEEVIPIGSLAVLLHAAIGIRFDVTQPRDLDEARNYRVFSELRGAMNPKFARPDISGSFKPAEFVHPFGSHYSTPGYLDSIVLPRFFAAADEHANKKDIQTNASGFLAFVYVTFLLVHPFVDGNGRVVRGILNYYNKKLNLGLSGYWNEHEPKFSNHPVHKSAFHGFFCQSELIPRCNLSLHPIADGLREHLGKMADSLLYHIAKVAEDGAFERSKPVEELSDIIRLDRPTDRMTMVARRQITEPGGI